MNHGINSNNIDLLNRDSALVGSSNHFLETFELIQDSEANDTSFMKLFSERFDLSNYIDYFIFQTYIQNKDWLGIAWNLNNVKLWRPKITNGKWRYVLYDTDAGFGYFGQSAYENYIEYAQNPTVPNHHSLIFKKILENNDFKCQFTNRYNDIINTTFQQNNFSKKIIELKNEIQNAIPDHIDRWSDQATPVDYYEWYNSINSIVNFNELRINTAREHLNQSLSLQGEKEVTLNVFPLNSGNIQINSIEPDSLPWTGIYHGGCPVTITANPAEGYIFSHWDNNPLTENLTDQNSISVNLNDNYQFIANFSNCKSSILLQIIENGKLLTPLLSSEQKNISYQWYLNERPISNDSLIYNPSNGVYQLTIRFDSCEVNSNLLIIDNDNYNLEVYPNPAVNELNIHFIIPVNQEIKISIFNSIGKIVYEEYMNDFIGQYNKKLDVSKFSNDTYFVKLVTESKIYIQKIMVHRN